MALRLRLGSIEDAPRMVEIYAPYVLHHPFTFEIEVPTVDEYKQRLRKVQEFFPIFVLEEDGRVVGFSYASFYHARLAYRWDAETTIYIEEGRHRKGYASILYSALLPCLKDQGFVEAYAVLGCPNDPSEKFHARFGFERRAVLPKTGFKCGHWWDVVFYVKQLNEKTETPSEPVPFSSLDPKKYLKMPNFAEQKQSL